MPSALPLLLIRLANRELGASFLHWEISSDLGPPAQVLNKAAQVVLGPSEMDIGDVTARCVATCIAQSALFDELAFDSKKMQVVTLTR